MDDLRAMLRRYALGIWRKRWVAVAAAWVICVLGWVATSAIPNQYQASARIYVDADAVLTPLLRGLALDNSLANQLDVLQRTLLSRPNLQKLISKTDLELTVRGPSDEERLVTRLATAIQIVPQTRSLFTITYRNTSPRLAYDVVQTMLTIFVESKAGSSRTDMENARLFLEDQISKYEQKLRQAEARRAAFNSRYIDLLPDNNGVSRLEAARAAVATLQEQVKQAKLREDLTRQQLAATPPTITAETDAYGGTLSGGEPSVVAQAEQKLEELRLRYTEQHPDVIAQRNLVEQLRSGKIPTGAPSAGAAAASRSAAQGHSRSMVNPVYEKLNIQIYDLEATIAGLQQQIADRSADRDRLDTIARGAPGLMAEYTDMNRDYDVLRTNYQELLQRREAMRLAAAADNEAEKVKLQVIDPPQVPQVPAAPNRVLLISGVLLAGLSGGGVLALLMQQLDTTFHSVNDLRRQELPVVGGISMVTAAVPLRRHMVTVAGFAAAMLLLCAVYGGLLYRLLHKGMA